MKPRNPVAGNAHKYNKSQVIPNKRKDYVPSEDEWLPEDEENEDDA